MSRYAVLLENMVLLTQLNSSIDYVQEGRRKGRVTRLDWRVLEHWHYLVHGCPTLAAKPWTAVFVQSYSWPILPPRTASLRAYLFSFIPLYLTCWICIKKRGRHRDQRILYGYCIRKTLSVKVVNY
jgi:hypothetical protein